MRFPGLHRLMHGLALVATLALAMVPSAGRVAQTCRTTAPTDGWAAVCSAVGLAQSPAASEHAHHHMAPSAPAQPQPAHPHDGGGDCDYCPLLASMLASSAPHFVAAAHPSAIAPQVALRSASLSFQYPSGLG